VVAAAPPSIRERIDVWGAAPGIAVMRRLKSELDPAALLAPGRFAGGI
jgi:glycolate oxidase FAD binding subunit